MSNEIAKKSPASIDNFAGWEDGVEGGDQPQSAGLIQGILIKFLNEGNWVFRDGGELPENFEPAAVNVERVVQKWWDQKPIETIILQPHEKFPDIEKMNAETPREEWVEGPDGQMRGPWQGQHILYLLDLTTMDKATYPTGTTGGRIALRELIDKITWMRRARGPNVYPRVKFAKTWMNTRFGGRFRPHFQTDPARWVRLGGEGGQAEELPPPTSPIPSVTFVKPADKPAPQTTPQSDLPLVKEEPPLTLTEELGDEIPSFEPTKESKALPPARRELKKSPAQSAKPPNKKLSNFDAG